MPDEPTTPNLPEIPESFEDLTDDALIALYDECDTARQALLATDAPVGVAAAREYRAQVQSLVDAQSRIAADMGERISLREPVADPEPLPSPPAATTEPEGDPAEPAAPEGEPTEPAPEGEPQPAGEARTIVGNVLDRGMPGQPADAPPGGGADRPVAVLTAAAGQSEQGQDVSLELLGAMVNRAKGEARDGRVVLAGIPAFDQMPEFAGDALLSMANGTFKNDEMIREARRDWREQYDRNSTRDEHGARTAAICDPLDIIREIPDTVTQAEPFADSLPSRPAGRLGYTFTPEASLALLDSGVVVWDEADQAAVDADDNTTWKPCPFLGCPDPEEVRAIEVVGCFTFDDTTEMSNPERVQDLISKANALRARRKEGKLLAVADTLTHHYNAQAVYGALDGYIHTVLTTLARGEYANRQDDAPYLAYVPPGLLEVLVIDRDHQSAKADFEAGPVIDYIDGELAAAGYNVRHVELEDVADGDSAPFAALNAVGVGAVASLPQLGGASNPFKVRLLAPESWLYASTGGINIGIERSPELRRQNRAQWFAAEYLMLAKPGSHPGFTVHYTACPNGSRADASEVFACPGDDS